MALASTGFEATVNILDNGGNKATLRYKLTAETAADAATDAAAIVAALAAITDGLISGYNVSEVFEEAAPSLPSSGVQIEDIALVTAQIATADPVVLKWANVKIPTPVAGIFLASSGPLADEVDPADTDLRTYLAIYESGGEATISDGEHLKDVTVSGNVKGHRVHRASRKG